MTSVDDSKWTPTYHVGEPVKRGRVVVHFPEIKIGKSDRELRDVTGGIE